ncbi:MULTISPECIES: alkaline phosphatase D family protein [Micromonospora]|uniref:Alkaline phosphatase family protein n=1 Tax=Micromonospora solifontis TaxID=2487138 RepID=A0ABX9WLL7_9ACTN|nr:MULTISPECIES: alkaline phosphatase D family protein [Micromonospora]NES16152.1 alkaline phosphatase family protein [Micromonospora sp. PPF5-17B]NES34860.1 alkaline phosphatase family protein [Micromonospora solifontis]NES57578.1 alkaline phosphatase family protein [Micromonospora sp. PPF5-6]RNM01431.1 alkaline phosphatase family protein [Micromonospora solifontis]
MPSSRLLIGPLLRRVVGTRATVWVETSAPAVVAVRTADGARGSAPTFTAYDHHYALVVVEGLAPDSTTSYEVLIDDEVAWPVPESGFPASVIRTRAADDRDQPVRLIFGSCRETTQHATARKLPPDALDAYARRMMADPDPATWPDLLVLLGDQVYADVTSPTVRKLLKRRRRRPKDAPATQVVSFDEYTKLYLESWRDPEIRWLLSTVPSVMIFDDHEVIDDWNTSASWRADMREQAWWAERIRSGLASYWVYQHLGNLAPDEIAADPVYAKVTAAEDATSVLHEFGERVDKEADVAHDTERWRAVQYQWSYALDLGRTRLVMLDNRSSRVLERGNRAMLPAGEWSWFVDRAHGVYDHLVVGASLPWLLPPGIHHVEAWNEKLADSDRPWVAKVSEQLRRTLDLEHWASFRRSFDALGELFARLGSGRTAGQGDRVGAGPAYAAPASISVLSGDVHHSYVARARFADRSVRTPVHQLTCSPIHNQVPAAMRPLMTLGWNPGPAGAARALARSAGVRRPFVRWKRLAGPYFGNAVATLTHRGRSADVLIEGTTSDGHLRTVARQQLSDEV